MPSNQSESLQARIFAEDCLLGAILIESTATHSMAIRQIQTLVNYTDFYGYREFAFPNAHIFHAMTKCEHPDIVQVAAKLDELGTLRRGDHAHLHHLIAECPTSLDYLWYARTVRKYSRGAEANTYAGLKV